MADFLRIFRMGLGRDSVAALQLLITTGLLCKGVRIYPKDIDILVFTDPGAEWAKTYEAWGRVAKVCKQHGIRCIIQEKPPKDEQTAWLEVLRPVRERLWAEEDPETKRGIRAELRKLVPPWRLDISGTIEEKAARGHYHSRVDIFEDYMSKHAIIRFSDGGCTENHKILPNRRLMDDMCQARFGVGLSAWSRSVKRGEREPHQVLLFIAKDEESRCIDDKLLPPFYEMSVYPLCEMDISKSDEQQYLDAIGLPKLHKSGCVGCKYQGLEFFWALSIVEPEQFLRIETYEGVAADKSHLMTIFPKLKGRPRLRAAVKAWRALNPGARVRSVLKRDYKRNDRRGKPVPKEK